MSAHQKLDSPLLGAVVRTLVGMTIAAAAVTHLLSGAGPFLWGVLAGGFIQVANLGALIWLGVRLARAETRGAAFYTLLFMVKIALLAGVAIYVVKMLPVDVVGFIVGVALLMPAALLASAIQPLADSPNAVEVKA